MDCSGGKAFDDLFYGWLESNVEECVPEDTALSGSFGGSNYSVNYFGGDYEVGWGSPVGEVGNVP